MARCGHEENLENEEYLLREVKKNRNKILAAIDLVNEIGLFHDGTEEQYVNWSSEKIVDLKQWINDINIRFEEALETTGYQGDLSADRVHKFIEFARDEIVEHDNAAEDLKERFQEAIEATAAGESIGDEEDSYTEYLGWSVEKIQYLEEQVASKSQTQKQLSEANLRIKELEQEVQSETDRADSLSQSLQQEIAKAPEKQTLIQELYNERQLSSQYQAQISQLQNTIRDHSSVLDGHLTTIQTHTATINQNEATIQEYQNTTGIYVNEIQAQNATIAQLKCQIQQGQNDVLNHQANTQALESKIKEHETTIQQWQDQAVSYHTNNQELKEKVKQHESTISEMEHIIERQKRQQSTQIIVEEHIKLTTDSFKARQEGAGESLEQGHVETMQEAFDRMRREPSKYATQQELHTDEEEFGEEGSKARQEGAGESLEQGHVETMQAAFDRMRREPSKYATQQELQTDKEEFVEESSEWEDCDGEDAIASDREEEQQGLAKPEHHQISYQSVSHPSPNIVQLDDKLPDSSSVVVQIHGHADDRQWMEELRDAQNENFHLGRSSNSSEEHHQLLNWELQGTQSQRNWSESQNHFLQINLDAAKDMSEHKQTLIDEQAKKMKRMERELGDSQRELGDSQRELGDSQRKLGDSQRALKHMEECYDKAKERLSTATTEHSEKMKRIEELSAANKRLDKQVSLLSREAEEFHKDAAAYDDSARTLKRKDSKIQYLRDTVESLQQEMDNKNEALKSANSLISLLQKSTSSTRALSDRDNILKILKEVDPPLPTLTTARAPPALLAPTTTTAPLPLPTPTTTTAPLPLPTLTTATAPLPLPTLTTATAPLPLPTLTTTTAPLPLPTLTTTMAPLPLPALTTTAAPLPVQQSKPVELSGDAWDNEISTDSSIFNDARISEDFYGTEQAFMFQDTWNFDDGSSGKKKGRRGGKNHDRARKAAEKAAEATESDCETPELAIEITTVYDCLTSEVVSKSESVAVQSISEDSSSPATVVQAATGTMYTTRKPSMAVALLSALWKLRFYILIAIFVYLHVITFVKHETLQEPTPIVQPEEQDFEDFIPLRLSDYGETVVFLPDQASPNVSSAFWSLALAIVAFRAPMGARFYYHR